MEEEEKGGREINTESAGLEQEPLCLSDPPRITLAMPQPLILGLSQCLVLSLPHGLMNSSLCVWILASQLLNAWLTDSNALENCPQQR